MAARSPYGLAINGCPCLDPLLMDSAWRGGLPQLFHRSRRRTGPGDLAPWRGWPRSREFGWSAGIAARSGGHPGRGSADAATHALCVRFDRNAVSLPSPQKRSAADELIRVRYRQREPGSTPVIRFIGIAYSRGAGAALMGEDGLFPDVSHGWRPLALVSFPAPAAGSYHGIGAPARFTASSVAVGERATASRNPRQESLARR